MRTSRKTGRGRIFGAKVAPMHVREERKTNPSGAAQRPGDFMERLDEKAFLIKIDADTFVRRIDGNEILVSIVPSSCPATSYSEADAIARLLRRRRRFSTAYVSDLTGQPVTASMLREAQAITQEENLPQTHAELDAIPVVQQKKMYAESAAFRQRFHELEVTPREAAKVRR